MKRSQVVYQLACRLVCPHNVIVPGVEQLYIPKAESILKYLEEEVGMTPPDRFHEVYTDSLVSQWEPENE